MNEKLKSIFGRVPPDISLSQNVQVRGGYVFIQSVRGGTKELRAYVLKEAGYEWIGDRIINGLSKTCCTNVEGNFFVSSYNDDAVKEIGDALVLISERSTEHLQR